MMPCSIFGKCLNMFGTTWVCEFGCPMAHFRKLKCRLNTSNEYLASELRCAIKVVSVPSFKDLL